MASIFWGKANGDPRRSRGFRRNWEANNYGKWEHRGKRKGWHWVANTDPDINMLRSPEDPSPPWTPKHKESWSSSPISVPKVEIVLEDGE